MEIESGDILMCTVDKIVGTNVFVEIDGTDKRGTIILSEISAGRIRNLRDYVVPKKKIVCKVLRVQKDHIELSLRRVKEKEKKELLERKRVEKGYEGILKSVLGEKSKEVLEKINEISELNEFMERIKEKPLELKKIVGKEDSEKILEILKKQKKKEVQVKRKIKLISEDSEGLNLIKSVLSEKNAEISYQGAGNYSIKVEEENLKKADQKIDEIIREIEETSKKKNLEISYS